MKKIPLHEINAVSHTMLMALYFRAAETLRPNAIVSDPLAVSIVEKLDYDFTPMARMNEDRFFTALRVRTFDRVCAAFMKEHAPTTIVSLGCGLDTRLQRVDDGKAFFVGVDQFD
jgi:O-methyltransferase involved in polyketide biosynthesis